MKTLPRLLAYNWGTTAAERTMSFPCDHYLTTYDAAYFRAVSVQAPAPIVFRWLCQLRVAPYSYDWIDNGGRRSPRVLIPGLEQLQVGQSMCSIFKLVDFELGLHLTLLLKDERAKVFFGGVAISYVILPQDDASCRLVAKLLVRYPIGLIGAVMRPTLSWGDLVMMRKQLLTLKHLAERQSKAVSKES
ncbi:hypothetical protein [Ktedonospora formicarum]|uniref:Polyketide cyclase n=1 Tax=Ktedonospora formicarum TaxID=2778364 RepID=A0A8J3I732_9CHLR|nr:hypothetical protein [Ktedonospora formicarum]GHO45909.1 hypothetical protein KSX_40720 [Ktedonospora formicarum]